MKPELEALERLKACPFCGQKDDWLGVYPGVNDGENYDRGYAFCRNAMCGAQGPTAMGEDRVVEKWNTRPSPPWLRAEEVTEPGWYWFKNHFRFITAVQRSVDGELYANDRDLLFQPIKEIGDENARWQRIPEPELPEEGES